MKRKQYKNNFLANRREESFIQRRVKKAQANGRVPYKAIMNEYNSHYGKNCHVNSLVSYVRHEM